MGCDLQFGDTVETVSLVTDILPLETRCLAGHNHPQLTRPFLKTSNPFTQRRLTTLPFCRFLQHGICMHWCFSNELTKPYVIVHKPSKRAGLCENEMCHTGTRLLVAVPGTPSPPDVTKLPGTGQQFLSPQPSGTVNKSEQQILNIIRELSLLHNNNTTCISQMIYERNVSLIWLFPIMYHQLRIFHYLEYRFACIYCISFSCFFLQSLNFPCKVMSGSFLAFCTEVPGVVNVCALQECLKNLQYKI